MRLTCPNCGAQYEVPETAIPEAGRDVQCSACNEAWVQHRPEAAVTGADHRPASAPEPGTTSAAAPSPERAPRRLDPGVAEILRTEAARERAKRAAASTGGVSTHSDPAPASPQADLPDPERINSSLTAARAQPDAPVARSIHAGRSGFGTGFWVALVAFGLAAGVYLAASDLVALVPEAETPVARYVTAIDDARLRLDAVVDRMMAQISGD